MENIGDGADSENRGSGDAASRDAAGQPPGGRVLHRPGPPGVYDPSAPLRPGPRLGDLGLLPDDWRQWLRDEAQADVQSLRRETRTGRPCGSAAFIERLESMLARKLSPAKRGPKPKQKVTNIEVK